MQYRHVLENTNGHYAAFLSAEYPYYLIMHVDWWVLTRDEGVDDIKGCVVLRDGTVFCDEVDNDRLKFSTYLPPHFDPNPITLSLDPEEQSTPEQIEAARNWQVIHQIQTEAIQHFDKYDEIEQFYGGGASAGPEPEPEGGSQTPQSV